MTYDQRPPTPADPVEPFDETQTVVERETYVERPAPVAYSTPPPATSNVNVSGGGGYVATGPGPLFWAKRIVSLVFGILAVLLVLRIFLLLLTADEGNSIVDFVYTMTEPFVAPFRGIFQIDEVVSGDATLDIAAVVALIGWTLIYALIMAILRIGDRRSYD
jgi:uncharacterized protein YggT (Ycf19 family)